MMKKLNSSRTALLALTLSLLAAAHPAQAQSTSEKAAQKAFEEALKLLDKGKVAEACPKLEESQRLDPAMGTQFRLAECWEKLGRTASAWTLFRQVVSEAQAAGRNDRASVSSVRATALEPRLTRILILVAPSARVPGLIVRRDGAVVEEALWGHGVAVDPGEHVISASASGKKGWETQQQALSGLVEVTVPTLAPVPIVDVFEETSKPSIEKPVGPPAPHRSLAPGLALAGAALAGVGAGVILAVAANGKRSDIATLQSEIKGSGLSTCRGGASPACADLADTTRAAGTLSNAAFWTLVGSGLVAAGAVTYFVWPAAKPASASATVIHVLPSVGVSDFGLSATGTF
jgi:hypothetical protein